MTDTKVTVRTTGRPRPRSARAEGALVLATGIGVVLAVAGIVIGITMAAHRREVGCENGHYFPEGTTDFRCFSNQHLAEGAAVAVLAAMLGIVIVMCSVLCRRLVLNPPAAAAPDAESADTD